MASFAVLRKRKRHRLHRFRRIFSTLTLRELLPADSYRSNKLVQRLQRDHIAPRYILSLNPGEKKSV
jgi:hypothetical protein